MCTNCANQSGIACFPKGEEKAHELPEEKWLVFLFHGFWWWCSLLGHQDEMKYLEYLCCDLQSYQIPCVEEHFPEAERLTQ